MSPSKEASISGARVLAYFICATTPRKAIDSQSDTYIRSVIRPKIIGCEICICMVGENTHRSRKWVPWEIGIALEEKKEIYAMRFWDTSNAITPSVLANNGIRPFDWDVNKLFQKIG